MIDLTAARQAHFLRRWLELEVVRKLAIDPKPEVVAQLRECIDTQRAHAKSGNLKGFSDADRAFHRIMYDAAGVPDMWLLIAPALRPARPAAAAEPADLCKIETVLADHQAIADAITESRQPELAQAFLRKRVRHARQHRSAVRALPEIHARLRAGYRERPGIDTLIY